MSKIQLHFFLIFLSISSSLQAQNPGSSIENADQKTKEIFFEKAKKAGLTEIKTQELLKIIDERNQVLKDLDTKKKQANAPYSIQDPGTLYNFKINNARNYYAQKINVLLTYKEYAEFAMEDYRSEAQQNAKQEYEQLLNTNKNLTNDQKKTIHALLYHYQLNQYLTSAYYSFDKTLQKPKLGILRFNFEKDFKKMCKAYNISTFNSESTNTNGFEWN